MAAGRWRKWRGSHLIPLWPTSWSVACWARLQLLSNMCTDSHIHSLSQRWAAFPPKWTMKKQWAADFCHKASSENYKGQQQRGWRLRFCVTQDFSQSFWVSAANLGFDWEKTMTANMNLLLTEKRWAVLKTNVKPKNVNKLNPEQKMTDLN